MIAQYVDADYVGVDYSKSLVRKHIEILGNPVLHGYANDLIFKEKSFDKVFAYSVFHYFPSGAYAKQSIEEMKRIARCSIFIDDLPSKSHREEHLLFKRREFDGWQITDGFYNPDRFNVHMEVYNDMPSTDFPREGEGL